MLQKSITEWIWGCNMASNKKSSILVNAITSENALFVSLLGLCPALAVTKSIESAFGMGILFTVVLLGSNILISSLRKLIPDAVRIPCYIVIIATFVTLVKMFANAFLPELYSTLGVFLSLLVVNCVILGRAEAFASKNTVVDSIFDALGNGIGFTLAILLIAFLREGLGAGQIVFGRTFTFLTALNGGNEIIIPLLKGPSWDYSLFLLVNPAGGFIVLGLVLAVLAAIKNAKANKKKVDEKLAKLAATAASKGGEAK